MKCCGVSKQRLLHLAEWNKFAFSEVFNNNENGHRLFVLLKCEAH